MHPWTQLLRDLPCNKKERTKIDRFLKASDSQGFLPVFEILKHKKYPQEAYELLVWGQKKFPNYTAARAALGREQYERGLVRDSLNTLSSDSDSLSDNILAQTTLFKAAILCGSEIRAERIFRGLQDRHQQDNDVVQLSKSLQIDGIAHVQQKLLKEFHSRGIALSLPRNLKTNRKPAETNAQKPRYLAIDSGDIASYNHFQALPLNEIFKSSKGKYSSTIHRSGSDVYLESRTLAEIYKKQGLFEQAKECYKNIFTHFAKQ